MEYIEGQTLEQLLEQNGPFPERRVLGWGRQLCDVLEYLHSQNPPIIFRDIKPGNIMLTHDGHIKLIDFGIARFFRLAGRVIRRCWHAWFCAAGAIWQGADR